MAITTQRYTTVAIALHWITAVLIIVMLVIGEDWIKAPKGVAPSNPNLHVSLGLLILILTVARLAWRLMNPPPPDVPMPAWQAKASKALHWGFYAILVVIPLSGLADLDKVIGKRRPEFADLTFFGLFKMPHYSMPWFGNLHDAFTKVAWLLLAIHVLAALKHQFIDKDGLLRRMSPH